MATPEKDIQNAILEWFSYRKDVLVWQNDSVGIFDPVRKTFRKRMSRYHRNGVSDILGVWKGRFLAIEVKSKTGRLSESQKEFLDQVNEHGGLGFVARSVQDVIDQMKG